MTAAARVAPLLLLLSLCASGPQYDIEIKNSTGRFIQDAHVRFDGFESIGGTLAPDAKKVHGGIRRPLPAVVDVVWASDTGERHDVRVAVNLPAHFIGVVAFEIAADNSVAVTSETQKE